MTNRNQIIMTRAWNLAREGAAKFGGRPSQYIGDAMRMAWAESRPGLHYTGRNGALRTWVLTGVLSEQMEAAARRIARYAPTRQGLTLVGKCSKSDCAKLERLIAA